MITRTYASRHCTAAPRSRCRFQSTKSPSSSSQQQVSHDEESVQGLAHTLRESITRLHQQQDAARKQSSAGQSFRRVFERARPQLISLIVSSGAVLLGMRSYYFQKTCKIKEATIEQQKSEIQRKNQVLVAVSSDEFAQLLAEKCAAVTTTRIHPERTSWWGGNNKSKSEEANQATVVAALSHLLRSELQQCVGDEILSESEIEQRRKAKAEDEDRGKKAAVRVNNETKLEQLRQSGSELPENVMQDIRESMEPLEVTTDETGNKVVRNKVFRI